MAQNKTQPTDKSIEDFINSIGDEKKRQDLWQLLSLMGEITGEKPVMWGPSIIGFGTYHYKYESGREGDFMCVGFSPRKQNLTLYIMAGFSRYSELMEKLGNYKTGKSCLYIKKLEDIDLEVLEQLIRESVDFIKNKYN